MVWIGSVRCEQDIIARTFALIAPVWRVLHQVSCSSKTVPKCSRTGRNAPKHEFRVQWCGSGAFVTKTSNKTSWHELLHYLYQFGAFCSKFHAIAKRFQMPPNGKKQNKTKHEFRVQCCGSGAFVAKNSR